MKVVDPVRFAELDLNKYTSTSSSSTTTRKRKFGSEWMMKEGMEGRYRASSLTSSDGMWSSSDFEGSEDDEEDHMGDGGGSGMNGGDDAEGDECDNDYRSTSHHINEQRSSMSSGEGRGVYHSRSSFIKSEDNLYSPRGGTSTLKSSDQHKNSSGKFLSFISFLCLF